MSAIYLDQWEIILATTILIREGQEAKIFLTPDDPLTVRVRFKNDPTKEGEKPKTTLSAEGEGNDGVLVFANWNNQLGATTKAWRYTQLILHSIISIKTDGCCLAYFDSIRRAISINQALADIRDYAIRVVCNGMRYTPFHYTQLELHNLAP